VYIVLRGTYHAQTNGYYNKAPGICNRFFIPAALPWHIRATTGKTCLPEADFRSQYFICRLAIGLFELYQGDPVFFRVGGGLADIGWAWTGYLGFCAGLELIAGSRIVPLYCESGRAVAEVQACRAAER
jgi:hypothetical protein